MVAEIVVGHPPLPPPSVVTRLIKRGGGGGLDGLELLEESVSPRHQLRSSPGVYFIEKKNLRKARSTRRHVVRHI